MPKKPILELVKTEVAPAFHINPYSNAAEDAAHLHNGLLMYVISGTDGFGWAMYKAFVLAENWETSHDTMVDVTRRFGNKVDESEARRILRDNPRLFAWLNKLPYRS